MFVCVHKFICIFIYIFQKKNHYFLLSNISQNFYNFFQKTINEIVSKLVLTSYEKLSPTPAAAPNMFGGFGGPPPSSRSVMDDLSPAIAPLQVRTLIVLTLNH
jgi:hypothetical protein